MNEVKNDILPYSIAVIIFIGFLFFIFNFVSISDGETVKIIIAGFIAWIGAIIGFYFGQKPVREMTGQVTTLTKENARAKIDKRDDTADLAEALEKYKNLEIRAEQLMKIVKDLTNEEV